VRERWWNAGVEVSGAFECAKKEEGAADRVGKDISSHSDE